MSVKAFFPEGVSSVTTSSLYQWDYGQTLEIETNNYLFPTIAEVHFSCIEMDEALVSPCSFINGVAVANIPDECLEQTTPITAWLYTIEGNSGNTIGSVQIPIISRQRPNIGDGVPQTIGDQYTNLITEVNEAIDTLKSGDVFIKYAMDSNRIKSPSGGYHYIQGILLETVYPVGSIYMSTVNTSPAAFLGGTWVPWGAGRVPVGVDTEQTEFASVELEGGEKKHRLDNSEMPRHNHSGETNDMGVTTKYRKPVGQEVGRDNVDLIQVSSLYTKYEVRYNEPNFEKGTGVPDGTVPVVAKYGVPYSGMNSPHNNLQPYVTCYMWKRTA